MSELAGVSVEQKVSSIPWMAALGGSLALHLVIAGYFWYSPDISTPLAPAAAPLMIEVGVVASPADLPLAEAIGQQQAESNATLASEATPRASASAVSQIQSEAMADIDSSVELNVPEKVQPVALKAPKKPLDTQPQEKRQQEVIEPLEVKKPELTEQAKPVESQQEDKAQEEASEQQRPQTQSQAPVTFDAKKAETASAPVAGVLSENEIQAKRTWQSDVQAHLERRKRYPRSAKQRRQQGVPWVKFTMDRDGKVLDVSLYRASGVAALDKEAQAMVRRAEPLPPPPEVIKGQALTLAIPVSFFVRR